jgi:general secretion pathway protein D
MRRLEQEVTVVGDEKSNKLVISTSPRYMDTVLSIVNELDTPPPQVMIQVLLAEVTLDTTEQWGMDISVGPFGGEGYKVGSLAGGSGVATALGVPNLSVSSADFGILVRSLEAQGKLEILSNPQVTVNNNQKAEINVGDDIGVAGNTERSSLGTLISSVSRIPVGILMNVTPAISEDGFVRMEITPEISQLTNRTTQINRDQTSPVIAKRRVDTVVTVRDGQSVVIGGLIQTTQEERRSKVPILGDIPVLGLPFRTKLQEAKKTELLVIVTPRVIPSVPGQAHGMAEDVSEQSVNRMEDSGRVLDYLESIKADIKAARDRAMRRQQDEAEGAAAPETEAEQSPEPATVIPSPQPAKPTYVQPRR